MLKWQPQAAAGQELFAASRDHGSSSLVCSSFLAPGTDHGDMILFIALICALAVEAPPLMQHLTKDE